MERAWSEYRMLIVSKLDKLEEDIGEIKGDVKSINNRLGNVDLEINTIKGKNKIVLGAIALLAGSIPSFIMWWFT